MSKNIGLHPADYIQPLLMNGLNGRMLYLPSKNKSKKREMLLIYGQHASIERMFTLAEDLHKYGNVTVPDLPGFGGMESFYKIGERPTLDNMADYLAAFVKMRYNRKRLTILGFSYGFIVATRMLQRYPELAKKVDLIVSIVGFTHSDDFRWSKSTQMSLRAMSKAFSYRTTSWIAKTFVLRSPQISLTYNLLANRNPKMKDASHSERQKRIKFEVVLWKCNDIRTYAETCGDMITVDLCNKHINLPVYHVAVDADQYFDNYLVEQHMRVIFNDFILMKSDMNAHMPTIIATVEEVAPLVPTKLRRILSKQT